MSVTAYTGLPGSGKSYGAVVNQIVPALEADRRVVTNIPLNREALREVTLKGEIVRLPYEKIAQEPHLIDEYATNGCVLVMDEVWRLWPSGEKTNRIPEPFKALIAEHRHRVDSQGRAMQIVLVTQDLSDIAVFARNKVEQTFHHTKLSKVGARGSYRVDVYHGPVTGAVPSVEKRIRDIYGKYEPKYFKLYNSHTMSDAQQSGADEKSLDGRATVWGRWQLWAGAAFALACIAFGTSALAGLLGGFAADETSVASSTAAETPRSAPPQQTPSFFSGNAQPERPTKPALPSLRKQTPAYRITGFVRLPDDGEGSVAILTDGHRTMAIPWHNCKELTDGDTVCVYDGHRVGLLGVRE